MKNGLTLGQKILSGIIACTLLIIGVAYFSLKNNSKYVDSNFWVEHTYEVIQELAIIEKLSVDAQTGMRGFVIGGKEDFLMPFENADVEINKHIEKIRQLSVDNLAQQKNMDALQKKLNRHFEFLANCIAAKRINTSMAVELIVEGEGERITSGIRAEIDNAQNIELALLAKRKKENEEKCHTF